MTRHGYGDSIVPMTSSLIYPSARNNSIALLTPHNPYMDLETSTSAA